MHARRFAKADQMTLSATTSTFCIRAVLPLVQGLCPQIFRDDDLTDRIKQLERALGSIRDLDARLALLTYVETRLPGAGSALMVARQRQRDQRLLGMRKLVKPLESFDIERELDRMTPAYRMSS